MVDTAAHLENLAHSLQTLAPGLVFWSGVGFLDAVPDPLRDAVGEEWGADSVEGYLSYLSFSKSNDDRRLTVVLAAPCPPDQLAAVAALHACDHLGCIVVLERRKPTAWGGWTLPAPLSPLIKRHSATGGYLDELGFHEGGWVEWESTEKCQARLLSALEMAREHPPGYVVVSCQDSEPEFEVGAAVTLSASTPARMAAARFGPPDTVYGRFSRDLPQLVPAGKLLWLDASAADAPKAMEQHIRMFRNLEVGKPGRPVLVLPSVLLPVLYAELRAWCAEPVELAGTGHQVVRVGEALSAHLTSGARGKPGREAPVLVVHGSGIPVERERGPGGLTDVHLLLSIPEMTLARPSDEAEARALFAEAMAYPGSAALMFSQASAVGLHGPATPATGRGRKMRDGKDLAILAMGSTVFPSLLAAESLQTLGVQAAVYDLRYRRPMDRELLAEAASYPLLVTVEEGPESGSFASHLLSSGSSAASLVRLTVEVADLKQRLEDDPYPLTLESFDLHAEGIARAVKTALQMGPATDS